jgi:adenosine kinase
LLFGIENPLLDISAPVDTALLNKYKLKANDAILAEESHKELYAELVANYPVQYIAGGAAQNTCRGAQYMLPAKSTVYVGCVGKDKNCEILQQAATKDGLDTLYLVDPMLPTGKCAVLITDNHRSMVTDLLAANAYKISHLEDPDVWATVQAAKNFYVGGYFLTVSPPSALKLAKHAAEANKPFSLNLSAPFIPQFFNAPLTELLPYADLLFGNETEAQSWADNSGVKSTDLKEIALLAAALPKVNTQRPRMVVFTQGAKSTIVAFEGKVHEFPVIPIDSKNIVDTTGAGDAFVGGFLAQYVLNKPVTQCVAGGHYLANVVIQRDGPSYPHEPHTFKY